jgi:hypothetical protein
MNPCGGERRLSMPRKRHTSEQIIRKLRQAEADLAAGLTIGQVCQKLEIADE